MSDYYHERLAGKTLTERELGIIRCLAQGMTNREVGKAVFLSEFTVKTHLHRITSKLEAHGRAHIVAICYSRGIL